MFTTKGIITYEAERSLKTTSNWWLTVELPEFEEAARYYRWFIDRNWVDADMRKVKRKYNKPSHPPHVSVIRGQEPQRNKDQWGKNLAGEEVDVIYTNLVRQTTIEKDGKDHFWFIDVQIDKYAHMRDHFGLDYMWSDGRPFKGHVTIARAFK